MRCCIVRKNDRMANYLETRCKWWMARVCILLIAELFHHKLEKSDMTSPMWCRNPTALDDGLNGVDMCGDSEVRGASHPFLACPLRAIAI